MSDEGTTYGRMVKYTEELEVRLDEILKYLRERCAGTCVGRQHYGHAPNCPVADLGLEEREQKGGGDGE